MSACTSSRKRKHEEIASGDDDHDEQQCQKRQKLQVGGDACTCFEHEIVLADHQSIELFASAAINHDDKQQRKEEEEEEAKQENECLSSLAVGGTAWKFEFYQLPTEATHDIYRFLDLLFEDKLCDWKDYIQPLSPSNSACSNNFVSIMKDALGVWRAAILFTLYQLTFKHDNIERQTYVVKIPLAGVDLHFRRQNVGSLLLQYTVALIHHIMQQHAEQYEIVVLVIDELQAKSFWSKNQFVIASQLDTLEYRRIFDKQAMLKAGFVRSIEQNLLTMVYCGEKSLDLVSPSKNAMLSQFETPKYVNFNQRYCKKHEIAETEKAIKEWKRKKQEMEQKQKEKEKEREKDGEDEDEEDEFGSDEDFDLEQALQQQSSDDDDEGYEDEDGEEYEDENGNTHNKNR